MLDSFGNFPIIQVELGTYSQLGSQYDHLMSPMSTLSFGRVSPVRFQLNQPVSDVMRPMCAYIKRKSKEIVETALECIAPGQSAELLALVTETSTIEKETPEEQVLKHLITRYEETRSWYTKRTILSIFVNQYTKSQLKMMIPGITDWRIDQARKHVVMVGIGVQEKKRPRNPLQA